jgi:hypothetical protein
MTTTTEFIIETTNYQFNSVEELVQLIDQAMDISLYAVIERAKGRGLLLDVQSELITSSRLKVIIVWPDKMNFLQFMSNSVFLKIKTWIDSLGWQTALVRNVVD